MHETMEQFFKAMELEGRASTVPSYRRGLWRYHQWLATNGLDPLSATTEIMLEFQKYLAEQYRKPNGKPIKRGTQATWLAALKAYYRFLYQRGLIVFNPARKVKLPLVRRSKLACDHLTQQEATAIIQTQSSYLSRKIVGTRMWAMEYRNLAILSLAIATGRRRQSMLDLRVKDLDFARNEVRVEWEKGRAGRVLPCASWAMAIAADYIKRARPLLLRGPDTGWLFTGFRTARICGEYLGRMLRQVQARTVEENPDLEELASKKLSSHSLRVTFATMLLLNGAGIRIVNELLLHKQISTSAKYTPLELDDLRRACRLAHPRA